MFEPSRRCRPAVDFTPTAIIGPVTERAAGGEPSQPDGLRVLIVDDHEVLRAGTRQVLEAFDDIDVVGEADDGTAAIAMIDGLSPNVVLIDVRLPDQSGIDVARQLSLTHPDVCVVILSAYDDDALVRAALDAGAKGYLLKTMRARGAGRRSSGCRPGNHGPRPHVVVSTGRSAGLPHRQQWAPADLARAGNGRTRRRRALQQGDRGASGSQCPDGRGPPEPRLRQARCGIAHRAGSLCLDQRPDLDDAVEQARALARGSGSGPGRGRSPASGGPSCRSRCRCRAWGAFRAPAQEGQTAGAEDPVALVAEVTAESTRQLLRTQHGSPVLVDHEASPADLHSCMTPCRWVCLRSSLGVVSGGGCRRRGSETWAALLRQPPPMPHLLVVWSYHAMLREDDDTKGAAPCCPYP